MNIETEIKQVDEVCAIVGVSIAEGASDVQVYGMAYVNESGRFVELAQARAIDLARQILEQGLEAVNPDDFVTSFIEQRQPAITAQTTIPLVVTPPPTLPAAEPAVTKPDAPPQQPAVIVSDFTSDLSDLPEVPW